MAGRIRGVLVCVGLALATAALVPAVGWAAPSITSISPTSGPTGTTVSLHGSGFTGATAVRFNGVSASFTISSDTLITTSAPTGAHSGPMSVTTPSGTATSTQSFTVLPSLKLVP